MLVRTASGICMLGFWIEFKQSHLFGPKILLKYYAKSNENQTLWQFINQILYRNSRHCLKYIFIFFATDCTMFSKAIYFDFNPVTNFHTEWSWNCSCERKKSFQQHCLTTTTTSSSIYLPIKAYLCVLYILFVRFDRIRFMCVAMWCVRSTRSSPCLCSTYQTRCSCMDCVHSKR